MTEELKTLKDLHLKYKIKVFTYSDRFMCVGAEQFSNELKQEAIKHIKSGKMVERAKFWVIDFFNITEEDLK